MGPGKHFVRYFVQGQRLVNFVCLVEQDSLKKESSAAHGEVTDAVAAYEGWQPQVRSLIEAVDEPFIWGLFDRPPLSRWSVGQVTLLGDAGHPMAPFVAQSAAQALEDGAALAACLTKMPNSAEALRRYETIRLHRTSRIQATAAGNITRVHLPDGPAQDERDAQIACGG